jgi:hypothetical protein
MKIHAANPAHRRNYLVYIDGTDVSTECCEADDILHEAHVFVRDRKGKAIRRPDGKLITAVIHGHVAIIPLTALSESEH